jgi:hypothetical protein
MQYAANELTSDVPGRWGALCNFLAPRNLVFRYRFGGQRMRHLSGETTQINVYLISPRRTWTGKHFSKEFIGVSIFLG